MTNDLEKISDFVAGLRGAVEEQPFGPDVDVFKVGGKIFAILSPTVEPGAISLKCDPDRSLELREHYAAVTPGYHLNKRHWNTVVLDGTVPDDVLDELIRHSHGLVVASLSAAQRALLVHE